MSKYIELPVDQIELDKSNPRIANFLATHDEDDITSELMALLLGTTSDACASLRQSIEANYGIIHPIIVNKRANGTYGPYLLGKLTNRCSAVGISPQPVGN